MASVALGTKVFSRTNDLRNLLETIPEGVFDTIYVADDGEMSPQKERLYKEKSIQLLDLEYDIGLSTGRNKIVKEATEDYLCICDTDHRVPNNITTLVDQLESNNELGGVGGIIVEPGDNQIYYEAQDFAERNQQNTLVRSPLLRDKNIQIISDSPFISFDFIPNAAVFRREVLEEYPWDNEFTIEGEHLDYYLNHWKNSKWKFGINPAVIFQHYPGGDPDYMAERHSTDKESNSKSYIMKKWGYDNISLDSYRWVTVTGERRGQMSVPENIIRIIRDDGIRKLLFDKVPKYIRQKYSRNSSW